MFKNKRYITCGVQSKISMPMQLYLWSLIDTMPEPKDYLQIFRLSVSGGKQRIIHEQEEPEYIQEYTIKIELPVTEKIYVIDEETHSTMLLASEC